MFKRGIVAVIVVFAHSANAQLFTVSQFSHCDSSYGKVWNAVMAKVTPTQEQLDNCKRDCNVEGLKSNVHIQYNQLKERFDFCSSKPGGTGAAQRCKDAQAKVNSPAGVDQSVWTSCQADCDQAKLEDATNQALYTQISSACGGLIDTATTPADTTDQFEGDTAADADEEPTTPAVADTGTPSNALPSMLQGTGLGNPASEFASGQRVGNVNFTGGAGGGGASDAVSGIQPAGFSGSSSLPPMAPTDDRVGHMKPATASGGGGGGNGSGGSGGNMPGGNMAGGPRSASPGYGGGRPSVAGAQLQKMNPNTFWSGGGASLAGGPPQRTTAATPTKKVPEKKAKTPHYNSKGMGDGGLLRLFNVNNPDGSSSVCGETVFCSMEIRYQQFELLPNSDLKP